MVIVQGISLKPIINVSSSTLSEKSICKVGSVHVNDEIVGTLVSSIM